MEVNHHLRIPLMINKDCSRVMWWFNWQTSINWVTGLTYIINCDNKQFSLLQDYLFITTTKVKSQQNIDYLSCYCYVYIYAKQCIFFHESYDGVKSSTKYSVVTHHWIRSRITNLTLLIWDWKLFMKFNLCYHWIKDCLTIWKILIWRLI